MLRGFRLQFSTLPGYAIARFPKSIFDVFIRCPTHEQVPHANNVSALDINVVNGAASNTPSSVVALSAATSYQSRHPCQLTSLSPMASLPTHRHQWLRYWLPPPINPESPVN